MTHLRQTMLEELQRRNYATTTVYYYLKAVEQFAKYFHTSPDQLNQSHLRRYQAYLLRERKLGPRTVKLHVSALRFFFVKTLKRPYLLEDIPFPKVPRRLPVILTTEEVARLIDAAKNLTDRTMLMVLYSTGMRNAELRHLQVRDIDSRRMLIHIQHGKGGRDRYVPLSARLLETLRVTYATNLSRFGIITPIAMHETFNTVSRFLGGLFADTQPSAPISFELVMALCGLATALVVILVTRGRLAFRPS